MSILVVAEREQPILELCGGARTLSEGVDLLALPTTQVVSNVCDRLLVLEVPEGRMIEDCASALANLIRAEKPEAVFAEPSRRIQLLLGRTAAQLGESAIANVMVIENPNDATQMYYAGLADRKYHGKQDTTPIYYVRPATFSDPVPQGENRECVVPFIEPPYSIRKTAVGPRVKGDIDLSSAKRIVSVGRGIREEKDLAMIRELCKLIDAEMGCSRSLYEAESWLPKEALVGISGSSVAPDLYLAVGISGQAQHMVACDPATTMMCINTDPYALIFEHSDYGSKGDLYEVVPRLIEYLKQHPLK